MSADIMYWFIRTSLFVVVFIASVKSNILMLYIRIVQIQLPAWNIRWRFYLISEWRLLDKSLTNVALPSTIQ